MAYFKNKETGLIWDVSNKELIDRLSKDNDYEEVEEPKKEYIEMTVPELKKIAKEKEIPGYNDMKRDELIEAIEKGD